MWEEWIWFQPRMGRRAHLSFLQPPSPIPAVPEGHLKIAQHFSAGSARVEAPSPDRDGRPSLPATRSSLRDLRVESPRTQHSSAGLFSVVPAGRPKPCRIAAKTEMRPGAHLSFLQPDWQMAAVLPHPYPLPLGEGAASPALRQPERLLSAARGRQFSLSQRERAGVRENASIAPGRHDRSAVARPPFQKLRCAPSVARAPRKLRRAPVPGRSRVERREAITDPTAPCGRTSLRPRTAALRGCPATISLSRSPALPTLRP